MTPERPPTADLKLSDEALGEALARALRESEDLDFVTASRLRTARRRALDDARLPPPRPTFAPWLAGGGAATLALAAVLWTPLQHLQPAAVQSTDDATAAAMEALIRENDPAFSDDIELYQWLSDKTPHDPRAGSA